MRICPGITTTFVRELRLSLSGNYDPAVRFRWQFANGDCFQVYILRKLELRFSIPDLDSLSFGALAALVQTY